MKTIPWIRRALALLAAAALLAAFPACSLADDGSDDGVYKLLRKGDRDEEDELHVYYLQVQLTIYNYLSQAPSGVFDEATRDALIEFQRANSLTINGIADRETQALLYGDPSSVTAKPAAKQVFSDAGDSDTVVAQTLLSRWGFLASRADGKFGKATQQAVRDFKTYLHRNKIGDLYTDNVKESSDDEDDEYLDVLMAGDMPLVHDVKIADIENDGFKPSGDISDELFTYMCSGEFDVFRTNVSRHDNNLDVLRVQRRLKSLGYLYSGQDGDYGANTERALMYFQYRNNLPESGIADEPTQEMLFSADAVSSDQYIFPYKLIVDVSDQRVYAYQWNGRSYDELVRTMKCSTGTRANPTLIGTFQAYGPLSGEWYYFKKFDCYAKWAFGIVGGYLFHSVIYSSPNNSSLQSGTLSALGRRASHGCVRLTVDDASWIYHNCPYGITVVVQE